jgi:hypothetical protein
MNRDRGADPAFASPSADDGNQLPNLPIRNRSIASRNNRHATEAKRLTLIS